MLKITIATCFDPYIISFKSCRISTDGRTFAPAGRLIADPQGLEESPGTVEQHSG